MQNKTIFTLIIIINLSGCSPNTGRKLIPKGEIQPEISLSTSYITSLGLRYGITDFLNAGVSINGFPFSLMLDNWSFICPEPYVVFQFIKQKSSRPALNLHFNLPIIIETFNTVTFYPQCGLTAVYSFDKINGFITVESLFLRNDENRYDGPIQFTGGLEIQPFPWFSYYFEAGASIAATRKKDLYPILSAGITVSIKEIIKKKKRTETFQE
jgi:hypothetical protein